MATAWSGSQFVYQDAVLGPGNIWHTAAQKTVSGTHTVEYRRSTDNGATWSTAVVAATGLSASQPIRILIESRPPYHSQVIWIVNGTQSLRRKSLDGGRTWANG